MFEKRISTPEPLEHLTSNVTRMNSIVLTHSYPHSIQCTWNNSITCTLSYLSCPVMLWQSNVLWNISVPTKTWFISSPNAQDKAKKFIFFFSSSITFLMTEIANTGCSIVMNFTQLHPTQLNVRPRVCMHTHTQTHGHLFHFVGSMFIGFEYWSNGKAVKTEWLILKLKFKMLQASEYRLFCTMHLVGSLQLPSKTLFILMNI